MRGSAQLGHALAIATGLENEVIGTAGQPFDGSWKEQLSAARAGLADLAAAVDEAIDPGMSLVALNRCAAGIATLPRVAARHPDAAIVWLDAHGDSNVPPYGGDRAYLGGMAISAAAGLWDSGFGGGLDLSNVILVGSRDLDPPEQALIDRGEIRLVEVGDDLAARVAHAVGERPVYVHLDCDVLDAGLCPTEFQVPGGLSFEDLRETLSRLADRRLIGIEIAEFEGDWPDGSSDDASRLVWALEPVVDSVRS